MIIDIRDIPFTGRTHTFTESDKELRDALGPLVRSNAIELTLTLYPVDQGADLHGELKTKIPLPCAFCVNEIDIPIHEKFHEIVMMGKSDKFHSKHGLQTSDDLELTYVNSPEFDLGPLLREIVESNSPIQPKCIEKGGPPGSPHCIADWDYEKYFAKKEEIEIKANPFDVLKELKVDKKRKN